MAKRIVDYDPLTAMSTFMDYVPETDTTTIYREQDVSTILDINKALQNNEQFTREGIKSGWWHYGKIPMIVIEKWLNEHGVDVFNRDHQKAVFRLLNQPEYRYLKTTTKMHRG